ncbi:hypothetical protein JCM14635_24270 [Megalodesulfovibrio paquesii]
MPDGAGLRGLAYHAAIPGLAQFESAPPEGLRELRQAPWQARMQRLGGSLRTIWEQAQPASAQQAG